MSTDSQTLPENSLGSLRRPDWTGIAIFYLIACGITMPLLAWRDLAPESWEESPIPPWLRPLLYGWGPAVGAFVVLALRGKHHLRTITLTGGSLPASLIAIIGPVLVLAAVAPAKNADNPHLAGLLAGLHAVVYAFGEEMGWRGYLQDALRPLPKLQRYIAIGIMWGVWHLLAFSGNGPVGDQILRLGLFYLILMAASAGIGTATDRSRSICVATACHLFFTFSQISSGNDRMLLLGILVPGTLLLVHFWPKTRAEKSK